MRKYIQYNKIRERKKKKTKPSFSDLLVWGESITTINVYILYVVLIVKTHLVYQVHKDLTW